MKKDDDAIMQISLSDRDNLDFDEEFQKLLELEELEGVSFIEKDEAWVEIMKIHERIMGALRGEREEFIKKFCIRQKDIILKNFEKYVKNQIHYCRKPCGETLARGLRRI